MSSSTSFGCNGALSCMALQTLHCHKLPHPSLREEIGSALFFATRNNTATRICSLQERQESRLTVRSTAPSKGLNTTGLETASTSYQYLPSQVSWRKLFWNKARAVDSTADSGALKAASDPNRVLASEGASSSESGSASADVIGVVIVDHGSRRAESNKLLDAFVTVYKAHTGRPIVEAAHMEIARPSIADAFDKVVERGANLVVISPYFLSPGRHWFQDIPELAAEASEKHPGVRYLVTAPIGLHPLMTDIIEGRIQHCLQHAAGKADECDVCKGSGRCRIVET